MAPTNATNVSIFLEKPRKFIDSKSHYTNVMFVTDVIIFTRTMIKFAFILLVSFVMCSVEALASVYDATCLWNHTFISCMKSDSIAPPHVARNLAILHLGLYTAYAKRKNCEDGVAQLVAYKVCSSLLPGHESAFEDQLRHAYPSRVPDGHRDFADICARSVLGRFASDGSATHVTYIPAKALGAWRRTHPFFRMPELPHWPVVKPILLKSCDQFRPPGPPALDSEKFRASLAEVKELGGMASSRRTPSQSESAKFWSDFSYSETPVGHWNSIARQIALDEHLQPDDCARLFCMLNVAMADSAIACWDAKYHYNFWRPITALQDNPLEGDAEQSAPPSWTPYLSTPSHPEYVSGHSVFSGAGRAILKHFLGRDHVNFRVGSDTLPSVVKTYESLETCALECGESRIYGGIHFRFSCEDGFNLGTKVAEWTCANFDSLETNP